MAIGVQPVVPLDPTGRATGTEKGKGNAALNTKTGPAQNPGIPWMETAYLDAHVYPYSDTMNRPDIVAEMGIPNASATAMVEAAFNMRTGVNVLGDGHGLPTPYDTRLDTIIPVMLMNQVAGTMQRSANVYTGVPGAPRMSIITQQFNEALLAIQRHLIGSP